MTLKDKLNFDRYLKKTNIVKIPMESIKMGRITAHPIILKKTL